MFMEYTYYLKNEEVILHGLYRRWYTNGQLEYESNYKDGGYHGLYRKWHENGRLQSENTYKDGELHGRYRHWRRGGELAYEDYYWEGVEYDSQEEYEETLITNRSW